jgi:hypothetical protein
MGNSIFFDAHEFDPGDPEIGHMVIARHNVGDDFYRRSNGPVVANHYNPSKKNYREYNNGSEFWHLQDYQRASKLQPWFSASIHSSVLCDE